MAGEADLILRYGVFPLWIAAGLADWSCHRRTRIERTSGLPENLFHWVLLGQMALAMGVVALCETTGAVLAVVAASFVVHELTVYVELRYTVPRRDVRPFEQMVHSFLELLPLVSLVLLALIAGPRALERDLRLRAEPWPMDYLAGALVASALFNIIPLAEESLRCWRARATARIPRSPAPR